MSDTAQTALDCSRPTTALFWTGLGLVLAVLTMIAASGGDWTALLRVGSANPLLNSIRAELGPVAVGDPLGHDGQLYYMIARDPLGRGPAPGAIAQLDDNGPRYRYRRILFPLLAGGFGQFSGRATLFGMMALLVAASGLASVAAADLAFQLRRPGTAAIVAMMNPGVLVAVMLLTADAMALALALLGLTLILRARPAGAALAFALAALSKEMYLLVPLAAAAWAGHQGLWTRAALFTIAPALPVVAWGTWVSSRFPDTGTRVQNFGFPLGGLSRAIQFWVETRPDASELMLGVFAIVMIGLAVAALLSGDNLLLRWLIAPWVAVACCVGFRHWEQPNNTARAFAILWPLAVMATGRGRAGRLIGSQKVERPAKQQISP